ncbi:GtrA family protein [Aquihabitans sp. McL0605]|uniref:GtrA family protein n=1 Tax=Aquihabitans sp. McL0605 TaxID=3415671 RepID=UPI003CFAAD60
MRRLARFLRYGLVSVIATGTSLLVLGVLVATHTMTPGWANVAATAVGTVPSFELNRRWVWRRHGASSIGAEVIPFAAMSAAGLVLSTLAVSLAGRWTDQAGLVGADRTMAIQAASLAAFGILWLLQFVLLDRVLFADRAGVGQDRPVPLPSP